MNRILFFLLLLFSNCHIFAQVGFKTALVEKGHNVIAFDISSDGKYIVTISDDNRMLIRDMESKALIKEITGYGALVTIVFSDDNEYLVTGSPDGTIAAWTVATGTIVRSFIGHKGSIKALSISADRKRIVSSCEDQTVRVWNVETGEQLFILNNENEQVDALAIHPNSKTVVAGTIKGKAYIWDITNGNTVKSFACEDDAIKSVVYSPNGSFFAVAGNEGRISMWSTFDYTLLNTMLGHTESIEKVSYSPDGKYIVSAGQDGYIILFDISTGAIVYHSPKQPYGVTSVVFSQNGKEFASSASQSDTLKVWDTSSLGIKSKFAIQSEKQIEKVKNKPEIIWITSDSKESVELGFEVKCQVRSGYPLEMINVIVNGEKQFSKTILDWSENQWIDFQNIVYLKDGDNTIDVQIFYGDEMLVSEPLSVSYRMDLAEELVRASRIRKGVVYLRESDEYEYKISSAEGYLFKGGVINVEQVEGPSINVELDPLKEDVAIILNNITFATNSADLNSESFIELDRVVELLVTNPGIIIEISAHTDDVGTVAYNMLLSNRRAQSVMNYLLDNNVETQRLVAKGYGPKMPMVPNSSEENRAFNRRVEFKILEMNERQPTVSKDNRL